MKDDDFWISRFSDNRVRGLLQELNQIIIECEDPEIVYKLRSTLSIGFATFAAHKERELRHDT